MKQYLYALVSVEYLFRGAYQLSVATMTFDIRVDSSVKYFPTIGPLLSYQSNLVELTKKVYYNQDTNCLLLAPDKATLFSLNAVSSNLNLDEHMSTDDKLLKLIKIYAHVTYEVARDN